MELVNQYDEWFGDSPARGINEPVPMMNIWGRPIRAEADVIEIYKRSLEEGSPGRNISAVKRPRVRSNSEIAAAGNGQAVFSCPKPIQRHRPNGYGAFLYPFLVIRRPVGRFFIYRGCLSPQNRPRQSVWKSRKTQPERKEQNHAGKNQGAAG